MTYTAGMKVARIDGQPPQVNGDPVTMPYNGTMPHQAFSHLLYRGNGQFVAVYRSAARHSLTVRGTTGHGVLVLATSDDYGATWDYLIVQDSAGQQDDRDPSLAQLADDTWVLTFPSWLVGPETDPPTVCGLYYKTSTDDMATWSAETRITVTGYDDYLATTSPLIQLGDGSLLIMATGRQTAESYYSSLALTAETLAGPWTATVVCDGEADGRNYDEPFVRRAASGDLVGFCRYGPTQIGRFTSDDDAATWSSVAVALSSNSSGRPGFTVLSDGTFILGTRTAETTNHVRFSRDEGLTWSSAQQVGPTAGRLGTYFSFAEIEPRIIGCLYSYEDTLEEGRTYFTLLTDGVEVTPRGREGGSGRRRRALTASFRGA